MKGPRYNAPADAPKERKRDKYARMKEVRKRKREEKGLPPYQGRKTKARRVDVAVHDGAGTTQQQQQERQDDDGGGEKEAVSLLDEPKSDGMAVDCRSGDFELGGVDKHVQSPVKKGKKMESKMEKKERKREKKEKKEKERKEKYERRAKKEKQKKKREKMKMKGDDEEPDTQTTRSQSSNLKEKAKALYQTRRGLPIFAHADEIRRDLRRTDVMLLVGETGSGKSTQVPQFLIDEEWCRPRTVQVPVSSSSQSEGDSGAADDGKRRMESATVGGCIAITEPRRVAAVSLAKRVADEMGTPLGSSTPASKVGYSVRFDTSTSPSTRVKYLTDGMLLQEMLSDPWLRKYSAVVVDEVHERGVNVDLILGFLRNMVSRSNSARGGVPLKVIVMSATADMESLKGYFEEGSRETEEEGGERRETKRPPSDKKRTQNSTDSKPQTQTGKEIAVCHIKGRQFPVKVVYSPEPVPDFVDAALKTIFQIHYKEPLPGDILVFMTGQETVESLENLVNDYATSMDPSLPKVLVLPLFAALPQSAQQRVFQPAPARTRKIILATNIAETSVTVSGVRYVVDCGKAKMKQFRARLGLDSLLVKPISKSAAIQRKGRAGREAEGQCYRLYTEKDYLGLQETNTPEILRCDISQPLLTMKARGVDDIMGFPFLSRPSRESLEKALLQLYNIQALDETGKISSIGQQIAKLPLTAPLGRVLLAAAERGDSCLRHVVDIISCLSVENIFLGSTSEEKKEEAEAARRDLYRREGDHLTMLAAVRSYAAENSDRKAWAERHMVSHRAMQAVMVFLFPSSFSSSSSSSSSFFLSFFLSSYLTGPQDVRKQLLAQCQQAKLLDLDVPATTTTTTDSSGNSNDEYEAILKSFLTGFATQTARLFPDGSYRTVAGNQTVAIHPSSVLFGRKAEAIMYNEYVFTNRSYARGVSVVQMNWIGEVLGG